MATKPSMEQQAVITSATKLVYCEAGPGTGKTFTAVEVFGQWRYGESTTDRKSLTLSFTKAATSELVGRIRRRWGSKSLNSSNRAMTIDQLIRELVRFLSSQGAIDAEFDWAGMEVVDSWQLMSDGRNVVGDPPQRWGLSLVGASVRAKRIKAARFAVAPGSRASLVEELAFGRCTHQEFRDVLRSAIRQPQNVRLLEGYFSNVGGQIIVDEVFDANDLDIALVAIMSRSTARVRLIGDEWQSIYEFRGGSPRLMRRLLRSLGFLSLPLTTSFRFITAEMVVTAAALRSSAPVSLTPVDVGTCDVVLAERWESLVSISDRVMPLSLGMPRNLSDSAMLLLHSSLTRRSFGLDALFLKDALDRLGLEMDEYRSLPSTVWDSVWWDPRSAVPRNEVIAMARLRSIVRELSGIRVPQLNLPASEQKRLSSLTSLNRWRRTNDLVKGLTIHQSKGQEWEVVGVELSARQRSEIAIGLSSRSQHERLTYVALTRARSHVGPLRTISVDGSAG